MTLFASILQNPQDPHARSDVKLMNQVLSFLSTLAVTEEQGGIKRMLAVCTEFERIVRVVLEKSDSESSRRKRRGGKLHEDKDRPPVLQEMAQKGISNSIPQYNNVPPPRRSFAPALSNDANNQAFVPSLEEFSPSLLNINLPFDLTSIANNQFPDMMAAVDAFNAPAPGISHLQTESPLPPSDGGTFEQPSVPQDLWDIPMTLEWPWADLAGMTPSSFGALDEVAGQDHQSYPIHEEDLITHTHRPS